jgi:hypothetical protein
MSDVAKQFIRHIVETGVKDPIVMAGSSDGGAHLASFTGADYSTACSRSGCRPSSCRSSTRFGA